MERELARLEVDGWELESAVRRHRAAPDSFLIPSDIRRNSVRVGEGVKLLFRIRVEDDRGVAETVTERMWVYVTATHHGLYEGRLQNQSEFTLDFRPGMIVRFGPEHICDVDSPPPQYEPL